MGQNEQVSYQGEKPMISIIIPVYNVEQHLSNCLDSALEQTVKDIEIICVNDCSTDNSQEILDEYTLKDNRIVLIQQETNQGQGKARNAGVDRALGKYIFFLDPDDLFYSPDSLEHLLSIAEKNQDDMVIGNTLCFSDNIEKTWPISPDIFSKDIECTTLEDTPILLDSNHVWNRLIRSQYLREHNIRFTPPRYGEDVPFAFYTSFYAKSISTTEQFTMLYRAGGNINNATPQKVMDAREHIIDQFEFIRQNGSKQLLDRMMLKILSTLRYRHKRAVWAEINKEQVINELEIWKNIIKIFPERLFEKLLPIDQEYCVYIKRGEFDTSTKCINFEDAAVSNKTEELLNGKDTVGRKAVSRAHELEAARRLNSKLSSQLDVIYNSYSWRITAPLRWVFNKLSDVRGR